MISTIGSSGPGDWLVETVDEIVFRNFTVPPTGIAAFLAMAVALLLGTLPEISGLMRRPAVTPWLIGIVWIVSFLLLRRKSKGH